ncbi:MAG: ABC transporter substrate-binding protein, partial [Anaerolineae bacterium]
PKLVPFVCLALFTLIGCAPDEVGFLSTPAPTPTLPPLAEAVEVVDGAILVPIPIEPPSFNAYINNTGYEELVGELVFGALAELGPDGRYYPELALTLPTLENGGLSEDGLTVTWQLRPGVKWSDGEPFTARDVVFTWQAFQQSGVWAPGVDLIEAIDTPDDLTAVIHYREFFPNYLLQFGGEGKGVFPAHACGQPDEMLRWDCNLEPVSTGPFALAEWVPGERLVFNPNPNYWIPDRPLAAQLVFVIEAEPGRRRRMLERGQAHLDLWPEEPVLGRLEEAGDVLVYATDPARWVLRLVPNLSRYGTADPGAPHPALSDLRVRQAIRQAIDVPLLIEEAFQGRAIPATSELAASLDSACPLDGYGYNPAAAAALLDEAGWLDTDDDGLRECRGCPAGEEGEPLSLRSNTYVEFGDSLTDAHDLIAEMLAGVGIELQTEAVEGAELWGTWADDGLELRGRFELDLWDDGYFGFDPTDYLADYFDPRAIPTVNDPVAGLNVMRYRNPELADLFDGLRGPIPSERRAKLLCDLARQLERDLPVIPLLALPDYYALNLELQGVVPHIYDAVTWNAGDWRLAPLEE